MISLNDKKWKAFRYEEIFKNYHGKRLNKEIRIDGMTPMLTASESNQGVSAFISNPEMPRHSKCVTVDMFGHAFYHNYEITGDDNIYFFGNDDLSEYTKLFIASCISGNSSKYSYGKQFRQRNADKECVLLPVNEKDEPDFKFMEKFIKERLATKRDEYVEYAKRQLARIERERESR